MTTQKPIFNGTISDSFLRSYSISRIVKINEQNRNKAKVIVMRKLRALKEQNKKHLAFKQNTFLNSKNRTNQKNNLKSLKEQLSRINNIDSHLHTPLNQKRKCKQCCQIVKKNQQSYQKSHKQKNQQGKSFFRNHKRFNSEALCNKSQVQQKNTDQNNKNSSYIANNVSYINKMKQNSRCCKHDILKAQLRKSDISFQKSKLISKKQNINKNLQQEFQNSKQSLSPAIRSINRFKLMSNTSSNSKLMQHFYKRSLQNCTLQDIKYLILMQKLKKQNQQKNYTLEPMRFGKKYFGDYIQPQIQKQNQNQIGNNGSVLNNQKLRQNCILSQNNKIINRKQESVNKIADKFKIKQHKKNRLSQGGGINRQNQIRSLNSKQAQFQKNLIYQYEDKKFPMHSNKLNVTYQKWKEQYIKKKRIQDLRIQHDFSKTISFDNERNLNRNDQQNIQIRNRIIKGKSIKIFKQQKNQEQKVKPNDAKTQKVKSSQINNIEHEDSFSSSNTSNQENTNHQNFQQRYNIF